MTSVPTIHFCTIGCPICERGDLALLDINKVLRDQARHGGRGPGVRKLVVQFGFSTENLRLHRDQCLGLLSARPARRTTRASTTRSRKIMAYEEENAIWRELLPNSSN